MNLDWGLILTIFGTLVTAISIYLVFKFRNKPRLVYVINSIISPIHISKSIREIEIQYKGKPISENLFLLNVTFINAGNVDIDKSAVHQDLSIILPEKFQWLDNNVVDKSSKLSVELNSKQNNLSFKWDLLKPNEYFTFESLVEYEGKNIREDSKKLKKLSFDYRIKDINKIETLEKSNLLKTFPFIAFTGLVLLIGYLGYLLIDKYYNQKDEVKFSLQLQDQSFKEIKELKFESNDKNIILKNEKNKELDSIKFMDSTMSLNFKTSVIKTEPSLMSLIGGILFLLLSPIMFLYLLRRFISDFTIKKILNKQ